MILPFDPTGELIVIPAHVFGPNGVLILRFVLDTGATGSMLGWGHAEDLGYDPASIVERATLTTASGVELAPRLSIQKLAALGQELNDFPILCHSLPANTEIDGVLGLDFFRGHKLTIDLRIGLVTLE